MSDVMQICRNHGVANASFSKDVKGLLLDLQELENLFVETETTTTDLAILLKAKAIAKEGSQDGRTISMKLSPHSVALFAKAKGLVGRNAPAYIIIGKVIELNRAKQSKTSKNVLFRLADDIPILEKMQKIFKKAHEETLATLKKLSAATRHYMDKVLSSSLSVTTKISTTIGKVKGKIIHLDAKIIAAKKKISGSKIFNKTLKDKVKTTRSAAAVNKIIRGICLLHKQAVVKPKPKPFLPAWLDIGLTAVMGYGALLPADKKGILNRDRGINAGGVISARFKPKKNLDIQVDLKTTQSFEVAGDNKNDKHVRGLDRARVTVRYKAKRLGVQAGAGWVDTASDTPGPANNDLSAFEQVLRITGQPAASLPLQLVLNQQLHVGWYRQDRGADKELTVRAIAQPGLAYQISIPGHIKLTPYGWGTIGYHMDRADGSDKGLVYGGEGGVILSNNIFEANIAGGWNNVYGAWAAARAFYEPRKSLWGLLVQVGYNFIPKGQNGTEDDQHIASGKVMARFNLLEKIFGKLSIWPGVEVAHDINSGATNVLGVLMVRWGITPAWLTPLRPTLEPLPEAR